MQARLWDETSQSNKETGCEYVRCIPLAPVAGSCEHVSENASGIEFLGQISNYQILRNGSLLYSQLLVIRIE